MTITDTGCAPGEPDMRGVQVAGRILVAATGGGLMVGAASGTVVGASMAVAGAANETIVRAAFGIVPGAAVGLGIGVILGTVTAIVTAITRQLRPHIQPTYARLIFLAPSTAALCALLFLDASLYGDMGGPAATRFAVLAVWLLVPIGPTLWIGLTASAWCLAPWLPDMASKAAPRRLLAAIFTWPIVISVVGVGIWYGLAAAGLDT